MIKFGNISFLLILNVPVIHLKGDGDRETKKIAEEIGLFIKDRVLQKKMIVQAAPIVAIYIKHRGVRSL